MAASSAKSDWNLILASCKIPFFETECSWLFHEVDDCEVDDCEGDDSVVVGDGPKLQLLLGLKEENSSFLTHMHLVYYIRTF